MSADQGFSRSKRLTHPSDYRRMFSSARSISDKFFVVRYQPAESELSKTGNDVNGLTRPASARLGTAVSKKAVKTSVQRNRLKRIIRESFRQQDLPACDYVVTVRPAVVNATNQALTRSINQLWQELQSRCAS